MQESMLYGWIWVDIAIPLIFQCVFQEVTVVKGYEMLAIFSSRKGSRKLFCDEIVWIQVKDDVHIMQVLILLSQREA